MGDFYRRALLESYVVAHRGVLRRRETMEPAQETLVPFIEALQEEAQGEPAPVF